MDIKIGVIKEEFQAANISELPVFLKKYSLTYEEYKAIIDACHNNNFWIASKDLNTIKTKVNSSD